MFSELLSRSMDVEHLNETHPAYPILIKQLSADEARMLRSLRGGSFAFVYTIDFDSKKQLFYGHRKVEIDELPRNDLMFPDQVPFYIEHLNHLGLAGIFQIGNQEALFESDTRNQIGIRSRCEYRLSDLGQRFMQTCS
jgi:hypothetical protein